jgi:hypothetical protein
MKVEKKNIEHNPRTGRFETCVFVTVDGYNPMLVKADAQFVADTIDSVFKIMEAKTAEWAEVYSEEIMKQACCVPGNADIGTKTTRRYVESFEVGQKLLSRIPELEP